MYGGHSLFWWFLVIAVPVRVTTSYLAFRILVPLYHRRFDEFVVPGIICGALLAVAMAVHDVLQMVLLEVYQHL